MKTKPKIILTMLLVLGMVLSLVPITAFAGVTDVTGGNTSNTYTHTYHTKVETTAQVSIKDADGNVAETTTVSKTGDFIEGNVSSDAVQAEIARIDNEINAQFSSRGNISIENRNSKMVFDHFESSNIITPNDDILVGDQEGLENAASGSVNKNLDVHEYQVYQITYDLIVQETAEPEETQVITTVDIGNIWKDLDSTKPVAFTAEVNPNSDCVNKMTLAEEFWQQNDDPNASRITSSNPSNPIASVTYNYGVTLTAKDGYIFHASFKYGGEGGTTVICDANDMAGHWSGSLSEDQKQLTIYFNNIQVTAVAGSSQDEATINEVNIDYVKLSYDHGDTPQATAEVSSGDQNKYDILYESWEKRDEIEENTIGAVGYWFSDESWYSGDDVHFGTFDKEGQYQYSVRLEAKNGFTFSGSISLENIMLNGKNLPDGSSVMVLDEGKTCLVTYGTIMHTPKSIDVIYIEGATIYFMDGDKPVFTGKAGDYQPYYIDHERWETDGAGVASSDYWNSFYGDFDGCWGKRIETFEADKEYQYSIYLKLTTEGYVEGWRFDKNTKLNINGQLIDLSDKQGDVDRAGETIWFQDVLSLTPEKPIQRKPIDVIEINGATISFKDGDKPVFTGKTPKDAPYIYQFECWETKDGAGVNSAEFFDKAYDKHITTFENGKNYQYILYMKAKEGYYFTADTKVKINGTFYNYRLVNVDPGFDLSGEMFTFWAYTDLKMTPVAASVEPTDYKIIEGANGSWVQNSDGTLTFRANGDFSKFKGVKVDETLVDAKNYTAVSGSTIITLKNNYLKTLSAGTHKLTVVYTDGECSTNFEIKKAAAKKQTITTEKKQTKSTDKKQINDKEKKQNETASPKTGDNSNLTLWIVLLLACGTGISTIVYDKKKRK